MGPPVNSMEMAETRVIPRVHGLTWAMQVHGYAGAWLRCRVVVVGPCHFNKCMSGLIALADDDRDIDLYHWSSTKFSRAWFDSLCVLVARGRAKVSAAAAASDWPIEPKRIRDMQYIDVDDSD